MNLNLFNSVDLCNTDICSHFGKIRPIENSARNVAPLKTKASLGRVLPLSALALALTFIRKQLLPYFQEEL
jgi:hypothetical protein